MCYMGQTASRLGEETEMKSNLRPTLSSSDVDHC